MSSEQTSDQSVWCIDKAPTDSDIEKAAERYKDCDALSVFVDFDTWPDSQGELDLGFLAAFGQMHALHLRYIAGLKSLAFLAGLPALSELTIGPTKTSRLDLTPIQNLTSLKVLHLDKQSHRIEATSELSALEQLSIQSVSLKDLDFTHAIPQLDSLKIGLGGTRNLSFLAKSRVRTLELWRIAKVENEHIKPLSLAAHLRHLVLDQLSAVTALPDFSRAVHLQRVELRRMQNLEDIHTLEKAPALESLVLEDVPKIASQQDFSPHLKNSIQAAKSDRQEI